MNTPVHRKPSGTYVGPILHLQGKSALLRYPPEPGYVVAQFDDMTLRRDHPDKPLAVDPDTNTANSSGDDLPADALGFGWHLFEKAHFEIKSMKRADYFETDSVALMSSGLSTRDKRRKRRAHRKRALQLIIGGTLLNAKAPVGSTPWLAAQWHRYMARKFGK